MELDGPAEAWLGVGGEDEAGVTLDAQRRPIIRARRRRGAADADAATELLLLLGGGRRRRRRRRREHSILLASFPPPLKNLSLSLDSLDLLPLSLSVTDLEEIQEQRNRVRSSRGTRNEEGRGRRRERTTVLVEKLYCCYGDDHIT